MTPKAMVDPLNTKAMTAADLVEMIAHKEQIGIWANEIATAISLGDMLKEDWSFDDSVDLEREIVSQLRSVLEMAFSHPEYDIASRVQSLEEEVRFLIDRLDDFERGGLSDSLEDACRDFEGHVSPAIERLRSSLNSTR